MKSRFLDLRNCHELLPTGNGLNLIARLDECLHAINDRPGELLGSIDALIRQNERTQKRTRGSQRLCSSPIEIAQDSNLENRVVHTQAVERRFRGSAKLHTVLGYKDGMERKTTVPLQFLLKGWGDASIGYQCYVHTIAHNLNRIRNFDELLARNLSNSDTYYYVGITSRNWLLRLDEHVREMWQGNRRLFYTAWRERYGMSDVHFASTLSDVNLSFEDAMNWEEVHVDKFASDQYGLNMIPGGFKGLRLLHEHRIIGRLDITLEERDKAIGEFARQNPRRGIPNPFIAELWRDDEYYLKVIESRPKTLSPDQVRQIRRLAASRRPIAEIAQEVGALNELQVKNVISGKYYRRME